MVSVLVGMTDVVEDTGGVPKMVGKMSNGRDPKIPEAATCCGGAITALSGRHHLTAAVIVKGEGGGQGLGHRHCRAEKNTTIN